MKNNKYIKTISAFLATAALLQISGISSKLVNGSTIIQANAAVKAYVSDKSKVISRVELHGSTVQGQTLKLIVKNSVGEDITKYCNPSWYATDTPTTDPELLSANIPYDNNALSNSENVVIGQEGVDKYTLEKEDVGKYIEVNLTGENPNDGWNSWICVSKVISTTTKVTPKDYASTFWKRVDIGDDQSSWYYLNNDGSNFKGWKQIDGFWYYFRPKTNGEMTHGWRNIDGNWYYFSPNRHGSGKMVTGEWVKDYVKLKGETKGKYRYYYLYSNGVMATNTTIEGHYVDSTGASADDVDLSKK